MSQKISSNLITKYIHHCLQYISYCHSKDFIDSMVSAYEKETGVAAKNAIKQILINSKMSAENKRPLCQDTGIVNIFVEIGMSVNWEDDFEIEDAINKGISKAYTDPSNPLRASVVDNPLFERNNTKDNTPGLLVISLLVVIKSNLKSLPKVVALKTKPNLQCLILVIVWWIG
jgi:fumarate hydratase class I